MSLKDNDWWPPFISRLQNESLADLCLEFGLIEEAVIPELIEESRERPIAEALWWAEACRQVEAGEEIRAVARRFGTHSRRLRKAMARSGSRSSAETPELSVAAEPQVEPAEVTTEDARAPQARPRLPLSTSLPRRAEEEPSASDSRRRRRGRLRLVRPEITDEPAVEAEPLRRPPRKAKTSPHSEVRVIDVDDVDLSDLIVEPPTAPISAPAQSAPRTVAPLALVSEESVPPAEVEPAGVEPVAVPSISAPPASPRLAPPVAPRPAARPLTGTAWRVRIDGVEQPMVVIADDVLQAAELFADQLGADALRRADIYSSPLL